MTTPNIKSLERFYNKHNLDIQTYTLTEMLALLNIQQPMTKEQLFQAKKKVMMYHPDKSNLPSEYFIFYQKAYNTVLSYFHEQNKQNQPMTEETTKYRPAENEPENNNIRETVQKMAGKGFNQNFNRIFEEHSAKNKPQYHNDWFKDDKPAVVAPSNVSASNINGEFSKMRNQTHAITAYRGVQDFSHSAGGNYFDDEDHSTSYISSDPFSKLKFDDLRKVHKDQTVLTVDESDFDKMKKYGSVDAYRAERSSKMEEMKKDEAERLLAENERRKQSEHLNRMHVATLRTMENEQRSKTALASFLRLN